MILTEKQEQGLQICLERYRAGMKYSVIAGYAGTGKSTLVKFLISALEQQCGINARKDVCYCAYTGKACQVLQRKGNKPVSTLHRLLWEFQPRADGTFFKKRRTFLTYKIVIIDECSMLDSTMLTELASHKETHFIFLGDPGQLPPIYGGGEGKQDGNSLLQNAHIFLDEVMRQAQESEIIQLSMKIREGKPLECFKGQEVQVINKEELVEGHLLWADQVICGTNATRIALNEQIRELNGLSGDMQEGDKVICLRNQWDIISTNTNEPLVNGAIGYVTDVYPTFIRLPWSGQVVDLYNASFTTDAEDEYEDLMFDKKSVEEGVYSLSFKDSSKIRNSKAMQNLLPLEFTYGYAITAHKSQGSEWDKVLVIEEKFPYNKEEHQKWLYTAATRAAKKLVIVKA